MERMQIGDNVVPSHYPETRIIGTVVRKDAHVVTVEWRGYGASHRETYRDDDDRLQVLDTEA